MYDNAGLLVTAQLAAVSSPVVQRHTPWNRIVGVCTVWCEAFARQAAKYQGETPQYVPLHHRTKSHGMTEAQQLGCADFPKDNTQGRRMLSAAAGGRLLRRPETHGRRMLAVPQVRVSREVQKQSAVSKGKQP